MSSSEWKEVKLGEVCDINTSTYSQKDNWSYINYLDTGNITENKIDTIQYLDSKVDKIPSRAKRKVFKNDIIYSTVRPNQKHYGIIKEPIENMLVSTGFAVIKGKPNEVENMFLYYYLTQQHIVDSLHTIGEHSTSAYPSIKPSDIECLDLSVPPLPEQKAIAATLSCLDDKIELNNRMNKNLEEMAQAIFKSWFVDFEPFQDGEFEESELGMIPKGWRVGKLEDVCDEIVRGFTSKYVEKSKFKNLNQKVNKGSYLDKQYYKYLREDIEIPQSKFAKKYDVLINSLGQGTLGRVHLFTEYEDNIVIDQHITILRANNLYINSCFLYFTMISNEIQNRIEGMITGSTGMLMLNISKIRSMKVIIPSIDVVMNFESTVKTLMEYKAYLNKQSDILSEKRDTLLPKLMSGEIRVPLEEVQ